MSGALRNVILIACSCVMASRATAAVPSASNSSLPCGLTLVGTTFDVADIRGEFSMVIRDEAQNPIPASSVVIDFDACEIDIRICSIQSFAGVAVDCTSGPVGEISAVTDGAGVVSLRIGGGARNTGANSPSESLGCATVHADGVYFGQINVAVLDQNGVLGVTPPDVAGLIGDICDPEIEGRSDFDCSGTIDPRDVCILIDALFGGGSTTSCSAYCH